MLGMSWKIELKEIDFVSNVRVKSSSSMSKVSEEFFILLSYSLSDEGKIVSGFFKEIRLKKAK